MFSLYFFLELFTYGGNYKKKILISAKAFVNEVRANGCSPLLKNKNHVIFNTFLNFWIYFINYSKLSDTNEYNAQLVTPKNIP